MARELTLTVFRRMSACGWQRSKEEEDQERLFAILWICVNEREQRKSNENKSNRVKISDPLNAQKCVCVHRNYIIFSNPIYECGKSLDPLCKNENQA